MLNSNFFSKRSKKEKILAFFTFLFVLAAMGDYFLFQPIKSRMDKVERGISINEKKIEKNMRVMAMKEEVTSIYHNNISPIKIIGSNEEEIAKFLNAIEVLSRQSYVSLVDIKPRVSRSGSTAFYKKYLVEAELEGPIDKIDMFLYNLQSVPQLLRVEKLGLNKKGETKSVTITAHLTISKIVIL